MHNQLEHQAAIDYTPANGTGTVYRFEPVHYTQRHVFPVYQPMYGVLRMCSNFHFDTIYLAAIRAAQLNGINLCNECNEKTSGKFAFLGLSVAGGEQVTKPLHAESSSAYTTGDFSFTNITRGV